MTALEKAIEKIDAGDLNEGLQALEQLKNSSNDESLLFDIAQIYASYGFLQEALEIVENLLTIYPEEGEFILFSAECLIELGEDLEALEQLRSLKRDSEYYLSGLLLLADLYQVQGLEEVAERKLLEANELNPTEPIIWHALAQFYLAQGDYYKANLFYEKILTESDFVPDQTLYLQYAETLSMLGHFEKALPYFEKGLKSETTNLDGLFRYGYTAYKAKNYDKTIKALTELKVLDPQYSTLYPLLANAYIESGNPKQAITTLKKGIEEDEHNEELYFLLSKLLLQTGEKSEAEYYLQESFKLSNPSIQASHLFVSYLKKEHRYEDIIEHILKLKDQHDENDPILDWELAEAYEELEDFKKASEYYDACYPFLLENSEFLERYGYFLLEEGEQEKAKKCFKKAITLDKNLIHLEELIFDLENRL